MARHWRRLALAASAAAALGTICAVDVAAQAPPKAGAKKAKAAPAKEPEAQEGEDAAKPAKKKKQDPAQAQQAIDGAAKLVEAGKADQAIQSLTTVLSGGNLPPAIMAKALFYRGIAYRQRKMPAQAIADLTSALWLKGGLAESDRADALRQRSSAYQEAGLTEGADHQRVAAAVPAASAVPSRTASADKSWGAATSPPPPVSEPAPSEAPGAPKQAGGWSLSNPFAGLFATQPSPAPATSQPPSAPETTASLPPAAPASATPAARRQASSWSRNTEVQGGATPPVAAASPAKPEGKFRIQVGMVRNQDQAQAIAAKIKREHAPVVAARETQIDQAVVGNMGSFYRVRVGPFASQQDGQTACAKLRGSGLDCLVVAQ